MLRWCLAFAINATDETNETGAIEGFVPGRERRAPVDEERTFNPVLLSLREALTTCEATIPLACVEKRVLRPVGNADLTFARYLPCPLIAKQLGRCELMRSLSVWRSSGRWGSVLPPLGATMTGEHEVRGA